MRAEPEETVDGVVCVCVRVYVRTYSTHVLLVLVING